MVNQILRVSIFFIVLTLPTISWANSTLYCTFSKYKGDSWVSVKIIKSWIPENQNHRIKNGDKVESILFGWQGNVSKDTPKRIEFSYPEQDIEYIYFRTTQKAVATLVVQRHTNQLYKVWGKCEEIKQPSSSSDNKSDTNNSKRCSKDNPKNCDDEELCRFATTKRSGSFKWETSSYFIGYVKEAKSRGLKCGIGNAPADTSNSSTSKLDKAKSTCAEIGFTAGTEDYGKCVLKMMDN